MGAGCLLSLFAHVQLGKSSSRVPHIVLQSGLCCPTLCSLSRLLVMWACMPLMCHGHLPPMVCMVWNTAAWQRADSLDFGHVCTVAVPKSVLPLRVFSVQRSSSGCP